MDIVLQAVLPFLAMIVVLIVVHELGHFFTAKIAGVKVLEFGLGYPPRLWGIKRGETEYTVNALPLGGFVRLLGEEDPEDPRSLAAQPKWKRLVVLGSGAAMNVVLAVALFSLALMIPREVDISRARIAEVIPNSPAEEAGLEPGDVIFAVNGHDVQNISELSYRIRLNLGEETAMTVKRGANSDVSGGEFVDVELTPRWSTDAFVYESAVAEGASIDATTMPTLDDPIELPVTTTQALSDNGVVILDPGTANEEAFEYWVRDSGTLLLTDRALGETTPEAHGPGTEIHYEARQGPTGITIGPAYGAMQPVPLDQQEEIAEELPPDINVPRTQLVPFSETQWQWPWEAIPDGAARSYEALILARNEIISRIQGGHSGGGGGFQVTGPVGIAQLTGEVVDEAGWKSLVDFAALISMNLAVLNILPLPMLDGGRIVFVLIEFVRGGKRIAPQKEAMVHFVGLVAMLAFAALITYFDLIRIFEGDGILR